MGNVIFVVIFVIFCAFLLGAGLISKRWVKESSDFVLAGREISTPINVVGVIAIGFAGTTVTLAPGFTIQYGLAGRPGLGCHLLGVRPADLRPAVQPTLSAAAAPRPCPSFWRCATTAHPFRSGHHLRYRHVRHYGQ